MQGGHELQNLPTNPLITRAIIEQVHALAVQENMRDVLKISNRTGQLFNNSAWIAWIAGVDYDNEAFEDAKDEDYEDQQASDGESHDELLR